jgi:integrase
LMRIEFYRRRNEWAQRVEGRFEDLLDRVRIRKFRFHDLRHTFGSWYMMNGGDLYELAKILGHANIKMTERYTKLGLQHIAKTEAQHGKFGSCLSKRRGTMKASPERCSLYCSCD